MYQMIENSESTELTELQKAGLDPELLEYMDLSERIHILTDAGLDPAEYDF